MPLLAPAHELGLKIPAPAFADLSVYMTGIRAFGSFVLVISFVSCIAVSNGQDEAQISAARRL